MLSSTEVGEARYVLSELMKVRAELLNLFDAPSNSADPTLRLLHRDGTLTVHLYGVPVTVLLQPVSRRAIDDRNPWCLEMLFLRPDRLKPDTPVPFGALYGRVEMRFDGSGEYEVLRFENSATKSGVLIPRLSLASSDPPKRERFEKGVIEFAEAMLLSNHTFRPTIIPGG